MGPFPPCGRSAVLGPSRFSPWCPSWRVTLTEVSYTKHRKLLGACHRGDRQMGSMYKTFIKKKVHPPETSILVTASSMLPGNTCDLDQTTTLSASIFSPIRRRLALPICPGYRGNNGMPGKHFGKQEKYSSSGSFPPEGHLCETLGLCPLLARLNRHFSPCCCCSCLPTHRLQGAHWEDRPAAREPWHR